MRYRTRAVDTSVLRTQPVVPFGLTGRDTCSQAPSRFMTSSVRGAPLAWGFDRVWVTGPSGFAYTGRECPTAVAERAEVADGESPVPGAVVTAAGARVAVTDPVAVAGAGPAVGAVGLQPASTVAAKAITKSWGRRRRGMTSTR